jgi:hypothetical protein
VLVARPSDAEAQLAYAAAIDLLDGVDAEELAMLSGSQRRALEVATLRAEADGGPPDPGATTFAFLNVLRTLSAHEPLVVAVDGAQWLDPPSKDPAKALDVLLGSTSAQALLRISRELDEKGYRFELGGG